MAIIEIKNNSVGVSTPVKNHQKNSVNDKNFEVTLSEVVETKTIVGSEALSSVDTVVLKNTLTEFKTRFDSSTEGSEAGIDMERVMRIKRQIENGTYEINPDRIASKMIQFEFL